MARLSPPLARSCMLENSDGENPEREKNLGIGHKQQVVLICFLTLRQRFLSVSRETTEALMALLRSS